VNNATPADGTQFAISGVTVNGTPVSPVAKQEDFAIAQFTNLSDADKVSAPSYQPFDAGVSLGAVPLSNGHDAERTIAYTEKYIDDYQQVARFGGLYMMPAAVHSALAGSALAASAPAITTGLSSFATRQDSPISVTRPPYVIASTLDLTQRLDILGAATTHYQATAALAAFVAGHPGQRDLVQVVPAHEAVTP
jgi:hypothetical protein